MGVQGHGLGGGKRAAQMTEDHRAAMDAAHCVTRCAFCSWSYEGTALEGRQLAAGHRRVHHPQAIRTRRRRSGGAFLGKFQHHDDGYRAEGLARAAKIADSYQ